MSLIWKNNVQRRQKDWIIDYSFFIYNGSYAYKHPCPNAPEKWAKKCRPDCKLCDGSAKLYMKSKSGHVTGGIYSILKQAIERAKEGYNIYTVFDPPKDQLDRTKLLDTYKGNRPDVPEWITHQMDWGQQLLPHTGIKCYYSHNAESDDVMATLALELAAEGHEVVVASDDKDMFPLLANPKIRLFRQKEFFGVAKFKDWLKSKHKVVIDDPGRFNEFLAICGDAADNFNLISGLGPVAAEYIIKNYTSCMEIFDKFNTLPEKYQRKLVQCNKGTEKCKHKGSCLTCGSYVKTLKDDMDLSLRIATLVTDAKYICVNKEQDRIKVKRMLESLDLKEAVDNINYLF